LEHPALARKPLDADGASFAFDGSWDGGLRVTGRGSLQACPFAFAVREGKEGRLLELELPETDLERVLLPLEPIVPEAGRARVEGSVSARVTLGPDARREIVFDLDLQRVTGALPPGVHLDGGPFTFLARDRHGELRPRPCGEGTANWASLDEISPWVTNAILASEDIGFYRHHGVDPEAIREALIEDLAAGSIRRGGSTLTQQLAKNLFLDGEQTLSRKLREALFAVELDGSLGKRRVLELYVNVVEWGPGIYGIREASRHYLLKDPSRIHPLEAAFLAALLPSPRRFHRTWFLAGRVPRARLDAILDNMAHAGWLDAASRDAWKARPLELAPPPGDGETADFE
jgi:hypothetical protein